MVAGSTPAEGTTNTARCPAIHGFGSFTKSELADGVDESFTVPESLAAGGNANGVAGIAVLGYSLFALGALGWVLLRRSA